MSRPEPQPQPSPAPQDAPAAAETAGDDGFRLDPGHLRPFLVAALVTALVSGPIVIIRLASPNPAWRWLTVTVFFVALEAIFTSNWLAQPQRRHFDRTRYRLAELTVIALALRLLTWLLSGGIPGWAVWRDYLLSPLSFFDGLFFGYLLCALFAWERAVTFSGQLRALAISYAEDRFYTLSYDEQRDRSYDRPVDRQRPAVFRELLGSWLGGGLLLALCAAASTFELGSVSISGGLRNVTRLGLNSDMLIALLVYFILGLWMISQARLDMMRARWLADGVAAGDDVVDNWRRSSLILLLVVALIAAFLPIGSTFAAAVVLQAIFSAALLVSQLALLLLNTLILFIFSLFALSPPEEEVEELLPMPTPEPAPDPVAGPMDETTALIAGGLFWLLVAAVAIVALIFFLRDRGVKIGYEPLLRAWARLQQWLRRLLQGVARQTAGARNLLRRQLDAIRPQADSRSRPWRFLRVNALPPREQVRYFYLSTVRRAADEGVPRAKSETPSEYARDLQAQWPEAGEEIEALTEAFVEARYSARPFEEEELNPIKKIWKRARRAIRRRFEP